MDALVYYVIVDMENNSSCITTKIHGNTLEATDCYALVFLIKGYNDKHTDAKTKSMPFCKWHFLK